LKQVQNLQAYIDELKSSYTSILFESGPTLTRALADNRVVDELCLTITGSEDETVAIKTVEAWTAKFGFTHLKLVQALSVGDAFFTRLVS
jgi:riboflavin biosynthesis pyrimidine reductase